MSSRARGGSRRVLRALAWTTYCAAVVATGVEVLVRAAMPQVLPLDAPQIYRPDDTIGWRRQPNVRATANTGDRDVMVCTDDRGDRVSCNHPRQSTCDRRILVVGDSFVEALAIPFEETVWWRLEQDTKACVDVAGVGAYEPSQYLQLVRERLEAASHTYDVVIVSMFAGNDFISQYQRPPSARSVWGEPVRLWPRALDRDALVEWVYPVNQWLESRSHAYVAVRFAIRRLNDPGGVGIYGLPEAIVRGRLTPAVLASTAQAFEEMGQAARAAGAALVITIVPVRSQVLDPTGMRVKAAFPSLAGEIDMDLVQRLFVPRLQLVNNAVVIDLLPRLRSSARPDYWGERDQHLSPRGHAEWFKALRDPVRALLTDE